ncbi:MAG: hypothetical protein LBI27_07255 [Clostridiales bacterium]|jgi:outer membrane lipoprotein-sorting protein|nr:hypothetical protein [Clostridiales bacterium]
MFKRGFKIFMAVLLALVFAVGCAGSGLRGPADAEEISAFERVQRMLMELESYQTIATVEYRSNKGTNTYETIQYAKISGEYRVEVTAPEHVSGSVTAFDGHQILQFNSRVNGRVTLMTRETPERSEILLTSFIKNYLQSEEVSVSVSDMDEGVRTVLEANIPGEHPYLSTARLWVDNTTLNPVKLVIFDRDDAERIIVTYHVFERNTTLNDTLFTI